MIKMMKMTDVENKFSWLVRDQRDTVLSNMPLSKVLTTKLKVSKMLEACCISVHCGLQYKHVGRQCWVLRNNFGERQRNVNLLFICEPEP